MKEKLILSSSLIMSLAISLVLSTSLAFAEDGSSLKENLANIEKFASEGKISKALEELSWVKNELEKENLKKIVALFPDELTGFKGEVATPQSAMGISTIDKKYSKGEKSFTLNLTSMGGSGSSNPMAGLAGLGQMAAMMGNQPGMETVRIGGRTATIETKNSETTLTMFMDGGSILKLESNNGVTGAELKTAIQALKIDDLETYLKGK